MSFCLLLSTPDIVLKVAAKEAGSDAAGAALVSEGSSVDKVSHESVSARHDYPPPHWLQLWIVDKAQNQNQLL